MYNIMTEGKHIRVFIFLQVMLKCLPTSLSLFLYLSPFHLPPFLSLSSVPYTISLLEMSLSFLTFPIYIFPFLRSFLVSPSLFFSILLPSSVSSLIPSLPIFFSLSLSSLFLSYSFFHITQNLLSLRMFHVQERERYKDLRDRERYRELEREREKERNKDFG